MLKGYIVFSRAAIEDTKKWGMLNLVNQLFKIYFKVRNTELIKIYKFILYKFY